MKKILVTIKAMIKKTVNYFNFNKHPFYCSSSLAALSVGIFWGLWAKDKTNKEKVICITGSYLVGSVLGFVGFLLDTKMNKERKAE